jgi:hypothetical protein
MPELEIRVKKIKMDDCSTCGENFPKDELVIPESDDSEGMCEDCYNENYIHCESCGRENDVNYSRFSEGGEAYCEDCYWDVYTICYSCEIEMWRDGDDCLWNNSLEEYECSECYSDSSRSCAEEHVSNSPDTIIGNYNESTNFGILNVKRLVGLEAECILDNVNPELEPLENKPDGWRATFDGSISGEGREMVSVPANGDLLALRVRDLCRWATHYKITVNKSCGLHLHMDATDTDWRDLQGIATVAKTFEKYIYYMLPRSRAGRWCRPLRMSLENIINCSSEGEFVNLWYDSASCYIDRDKYNDSRYHGLNLHARFYLGTVEFRYHSGTLNNKKIMNWIRICNSIFETGIKLARDSEWEHSDYFKTGVMLEQSLAGLVSRMIDFNHATLDYLIRRAGKFSNGSRILSEPDMSNYLRN